MEKPPYESLFLHSHKRHHFLTLTNGGGPLCTVQRLKHKCDKQLSDFAFDFNSRRYMQAAKGGADMNIVACADLAWDDKDPSTDYKVWAEW